MPGEIRFVSHPSEHDVRRARTLFPQLESGHPKSSYLLAFTDRPVPRIVGAAVWWVRDDGTAKFRCAMLPARQSNPEALHLMHELCQITKSHGANRIEAATMVSAESTEAQFMQDAGFLPLRKNEFFLVGMDTNLPRTTGIGNHLLTRLHANRAKPHFTITPFTSEDRDVVLRIADARNLLDPHDFRQAVSKKSYHGLSFLMRRGDQALGVILARRVGEHHALIDLLVAERGSSIPRNRIATLLIHEIAVHLDQAGIRQVFIRADPERNPATRLICLRHGGSPVDEIWTFHRDLKNGKTQSNT